MSSAGTRDRFDRAVAITLTACALVIAGSVAYRTFHTSTRPDTISLGSGPPRLVRAWEEAKSIGNRLGDSSAPVTIVELSDLQCPACRGFQSTVQSLLSMYGKRLSIVVVSFPLEYHEHAMEAARAAECADRVGKFASWANAVYAKQESLGRKSWGSFARDAGIADTGSIASCARDTTPVPRIKAGVAYGNRVGVDGTPTILLNGWKVSSVPRKEKLEAAIDAFLKGENPFQNGQWEKY